MDRQSWTELDERISWRRYVGWKHNLDDPEVLPFHLREIVPTQPTPLPHFERARAAKHKAPDPGDEEPSPVTVTVYQSRRRLRGWVVVLLVAGGLWVVVTAIRSLMGAS